MPHLLPQIRSLIKLKKLRFSLNYTRNFLHVFWPGDGTQIVGVQGSYLFISFFLKEERQVRQINGNPHQQWVCGASDAIHKPRFASLDLRKVH
jgi:hypothetical protein